MNSIISNMMDAENNSSAQNQVPETIEASTTPINKLPPIPKGQFT